MPMNSLIKYTIFSCSMMSAWTCISVRWVNLFWDMLLLNQVLRRLRVEQLLSDEAIETGRYRQSFSRFSASTNRDLVWEWSLERPAATSCTVSHRAAPLNASPNICSWSFSRSTSICGKMERLHIQCLWRFSNCRIDNSLLSQCCDFHSTLVESSAQFRKKQIHYFKKSSFPSHFISYRWQCLGLCGITIATQES